MSKGIALSQQTYDRFNRAVVLADTINAGVPASAQVAGNAIHVVRITSSTSSSLGWPAVVRQFNTGDGTWSDSTFFTSTVRAINPVGRALLVDQIYFARFAGFRSGVAVFAVIRPVPHIDDIQECSATQKGIVNLSDQALGRGTKTIEKVRVGGYVTSGNATGNSCTLEIITRSTSSWLNMADGSDLYGITHGGAGIGRLPDAAIPWDDPCDVLYSRVGMPVYASDDPRRPSTYASSDPYPCAGIYIRQTSAGTRSFRLGALVTEWGIDLLQPDGVFGGIAAGPYVTKRGSILYTGKNSKALVTAAESVEAGGLIFVNGLLAGGELSISLSSDILTGTLTASKVGGMTAGSGLTVTAGSTSRS